MATRSSISIRNHDGTYTGIYCHNDGYLSHNGKILYNHYREQGKILELMALGDLSVLGDEIGVKHEFQNPHRFNTQASLEWCDAVARMCSAYGRDRGEENTEATVHSTRSDLISHVEQEYNYLWDGGKWWVLCRATQDQWMCLEDALVIDGLLANT